MKNNIDKDIKILEELAEDTIRYKMVETDAYMAGAITRVLKELETYKKIAEELADELEVHYDYEYVCFIKGDCGQCKEKKEKSKTCIKCIIDWARKEVEKDGM